MKESPPRSDAIPGVLGVPHSYLSGRNIGCSIDSDLLPVPPNLSGASSIPSRTYRAPTPCIA